MSEARQSGDHRHALVRDVETGAVVPGPATRARSGAAVVTAAVELPPPPRRIMPADERAVALDEVPVDPAVAAVRGAGTRSIRIVRDETVDPAEGGNVRLLGETTPSDHVDDETLSTGELRLRARRRHDGTAPERSDELTADRLLSGSRSLRIPPKGFWRSRFYRWTGGTVRLRDSRPARAEAALDTRIAKALDGGARYVPVLTRKGGVGKTTVTALLGMALASTREDRVIAIDANPDRGTLAERIAKPARHTVKDVVERADRLSGFTEFSEMVARDATRLDVIASDTDPHRSEAFDDHDYDIVADLAAQHYSLVLTDCGTGIVHSVMRATLRRADTIVVVTGGSVDEARSASETLSWLESNGYPGLVRNAVVALNTATQGTQLVNLREIETHFASRVRHIVRIPYDPRLAAGGPVSFRDLSPVTRHAARTLAALVLEGLPATRREPARET